MKFIAEQLAEFAAKVDFSNIPRDVINRSKLHFLDWIGVCIAGYEAPESRIVVEFVKKMGGEKEATILGYGLKTVCSNAAFANGTMAHSYDFDDEFYACAIHPGSVVVASTLAAAENRGASGKDLIAAIVVGYEVMSRVGLGVNAVPELAHSLRGFHPTATCGVFGATAAAGRIFNLTPEQMTNAFGVAGSFASGLGEYRSAGGMTKRIHPGKAAHDGLWAVLLAKKGFIGPQSVFEGRDGFLKAFTDKSRPEMMTRELGEKYYILNTVIKYYACCLHCQPAIDAFLELFRDNSLKPNQIEQIEVRIPSTGYHVVAEPQDVKYRPSTVLGAQLSLPYCIALAGLEGNVQHDQFRKEKLDDATILRFADKVKITKDIEFDRALSESSLPAQVDIKTTDGKHLSLRTEGPRSSLDWEGLIDKFRSLTFKNLKDGIMDELVNRVKKLENVNNLSEITDLTEVVIEQKAGY